MKTSKRDALSKNNKLYRPKPEDKYSFGLRTAGNRGRDASGDFVQPVLPAQEIVAMLGEVGVCGVQLHDIDLVAMGSWVGVLAEEWNPATLHRGTALRREVRWREASSHVRK
jgi:hypothetical protein